MRAESDWARAVGVGAFRINLSDGDFSGIHGVALKTSATSFGYLEQSAVFLFPR